MKTIAKRSLSPLVPKLLAPKLLALLLLSLPAWGAIYRTVDAAGNVTYTDQPPAGTDTRVISEQIEVATPNTFVDSTPRARWEPEIEGDTDAASNYDLAITAPENDAAIRENSGNITVRTRISPALLDDHVARLELNGSLTPDAVEAGAVYLTNVPRGTHRARLIVENSKGRRLSESPEIVFHLQRVSILQPRRRQ